MEPTTLPPTELKPGVCNGCARVGWSIVLMFMYFSIANLFIKSPFTDQPKFQVLSLTALVANISSSQELTMSWKINLLTKSTKGSTFSYEKLEASIKYHGFTLSSIKIYPYSTYEEGREEGHLEAQSGSTTVLLDKLTSGYLATDFQNQVVKFTTSVEGGVIATKGGFYGSTDHELQYIRVTCDDLDVRFASNATEGSLVDVPVPKDCVVNLKSPN